MAESVEPAAKERLRAVGERCICLHTRMAARAVTRAYDAALAPLGLEGTQFTLLAAIAVRPDPLRHADGGKAGARAQLPLAQSLPAAATRPDRLGGDAGAPSITR